MPQKAAPAAKPKVAPQDIDPNTEQTCTRKARPPYATPTWAGSRGKEATRGAGRAGGEADQRTHSDATHQLNLSSSRPELLGSSLW
jgi:hypothetical protein